jgi:hypothetical protein
MIRKQMVAAAEGNLAALQFLCERAEGKARQVITGDGQNPIAFAVSQQQQAEDARNHVLEQLGRIGARQLIETEVVEGDGANHSENEVT